MYNDIMTLFVTTVQAFMPLIIIAEIIVMVAIYCWAKEARDRT